MTELPPENAYPLHWPIGWKRATHRIRSRFGERGQGSVRMTTALNLIEGELRRLGASLPVISTNVRTRLDGKPYGNQANPTDPGASVYFTLRKRRLVLACDKWWTVEENLYAIGKHVEAMRGQDRWGVGSIEQAFTGYAALPAKRGPDCWEILGVARTATAEEVETAFRGKARVFHPDVPGGSTDKFAMLSDAKSIALATIKAGGNS